MTKQPPTALQRIFLRDKAEAVMSGLLDGIEKKRGALLAAKGDIERSRKDARKVGAYTSSLPLCARFDRVYRYIFAALDNTMNADIVSY